MIEIGKTYFVENAVKKSTEEIETFSNDDGKYINVTELWRGGSYWITPKNEDEVRWLQEAVDEEEPLCVTDFEEAEMNETWDGCSTDLEFYGEWTDEEKEKFEEEYFEDRWETMEKYGFQPVDLELTFYNGVTAEEKSPPWK